MSSPRCDENCLSCAGSSRNCSRCKTGFTQLGTSCVTNHTCSNGEQQQGYPGLPWGCLWRSSAGQLVLKREKQSHTGTAAPQTGVRAPGLIDCLGFL